eukprot:gene28897-35847_t
MLPSGYPGDGTVPAPVWWNVEASDANSLGNVEIVGTPSTVNIATLAMEQFPLQFGGLVSKMVHIDVTLVSLGCTQQKPRPRVKSARLDHIPLSPLVPPLALSVRSISIQLLRVQ